MASETETRAKVIPYTVDGVDQETTDREMTPRQILKTAGFDPALRYLIQVDGRHQTSFKDKPDESIHMHPKIKFITASLEPTEVS